MAFKSFETIKPVKFGSVDAVIDEKGTSFIALRKIQWCKDDEEPDETKARLELRKWRVTDQGERADKGFSFLTEDGPGELAKVLIREGFGTTKELLKELVVREDFKETVEHFNDEEDIGGGELFDMRALLTAVEDVA